MTTDTKPLAERLRRWRFRAEEGAGSRPAKESVKVRPTDWHNVCAGLTEAADALDAQAALLSEAMEVLDQVRKDEREFRCSSSATLKRLDSLLSRIEAMK